MYEIILLMALVSREKVELNVKFMKTWLQHENQSQNDILRQIQVRLRSWLLHTRSNACHEEKKLVFLLQNIGP